MEDSRMSHRYRVYTIDIETLKQYGEVFESEAYRSWITFVSDIEKKEVELIEGVFRVIII
jgi:hypothetical protein